MRGGAKAVKAVKRRRATSPSTTTASSTPAPEEPPTKRSRANNLEELRRQFLERYDVDKLSDEEILAAQSASWRSKVYKHFRTPPEIIESKGEIKYKFICAKETNVSGDIFVTRVRHDNSTSNLKRHVDECTPDDTRMQAKLKDYLRGSTYEKAKFRFVMALWIARRHRPFAIAEDPELQHLFIMLYGQVDIPSRSTVSRDIKEIFAMTKDPLSERFKSTSRFFHVGIDGWTSPNTISILGITLQYFNDGKITSFVLDFVVLKQRHTGVYLAGVLVKVFVEFGIENKILSIVADNAGNNDTLVTELDNLLPDAPFTSEHRIRCFCHILNLVVKAILSQFARKKKSAGSTDPDALDANEDDFDGSDVEELDSEDEDEDEDDDLETDAARDESDERFIAAIANEIDIVKNMTAAEVSIGCHSLTKILGLAKRVFHSPLLREDMQKLCVRLKIEHVVLMRAVPTRWNSVATALDRALVLQPAIDKLVVMDQHNTSRGPKLRKYRLSKEEWDILRQLSPYLQYFLEATNRMSKSAVPLVHEVIPLIDKLTDTLAAAVIDDSLHVAVRAAMARGVEVLNKYYSKTDDSVMYRCAMLLHPRYKTSYFKKQGWPSDWIDNAVELLRAQYSQHYAAASPPTTAGNSSVTARSALFGDIDDFGFDDTTDPIEDWISTPPVKTAQDPLTWWNGMLADKHPLAAMALDILSAPASSTDVERAFSRGGLTVSKHRHALTDESMRAATVLSSWAEVDGLIPEDTIIEHFREKSSRFGKVVARSEPGSRSSSP